MIRDIIQYPDPVLEQVTVPVEHFDQDLAILIQDMIDTMEDAGGIGIAAPQIGVSKQVCVVRGKVGPIVLVNPVITQRSGIKNKYTEGCLSFNKNLRISKKRSYSVSVTYRNLRGEECNTVFKDITAAAVQHETDHLLGVLFIDE